MMVYHVTRHNTVDRYSTFGTLSFGMIRVSTYKLDGKEVWIIWLAIVGHKMLDTRSFGLSHYLLMVTIWEWTHEWALWKHILVREASLLKYTRDWIDMAINCLHGKSCEHSS